MEGRGEQPPAYRRKGCPGDTEDSLSWWRGLFFFFGVGPTTLPKLVQDHGDIGEGHQYPGQCRVRRQPTRLRLAEVVYQPGKQERGEDRGGG